MENNNKRFWQLYAKGYGPIMNIIGKGFYEDLCAEIAEDFTGKENILELACGSGQLSFYLADKCSSYTATDFSENMIKEASKKNKASVNGLKFELQDATAITYPDNTFDVVVIANALHIMPDPDKAMKEISRVLKSGGTLYAPTFVYNKDRKLTFWIKIISKVGFKSYNKWTVEEFSDYIQGYGFSVEYTKVIDAGISPLVKLKAQKI